MSSRCGRFAESRCGKVRRIALWKVRRIALWKVRRIALWKVRRIALWKIRRIALWKVRRIALWKVRRIALWKVRRIALWKIRRIALWKARRIALWKIRRIALWKVPWKRAVEDSQNRAVEDSQNRAVEGSQNRAVEDSQNRAVEGSQNRAVEGSQNRAVEGSQNRAVEACPLESGGWNSCGTACPKTCDGRPFACAAVCVPRCECYYGYVLDNGNCIPEGLCNSSNGCNYEGQHYNDGDEWAVRDSPGLVCQCDGTQVVCYVVDCAPGYSHVIGRNGLWTCWRQQRCPTGYTGRGKHCYSFVETPASFQDAERHCVQDGAILVRIDPKKMHVYKRLQRAASRTGSDVWIGLSDRVTEGTLTWSNGDPYKIKKSMRNKFWAKRAWGQNSEDKDCVYMSRRDKYRWRFGNCDDESSFICRFTG
ncbi:hypothetical protein Bbelb_303530 [Branchiostoma belcheri]|nr:hypothetical protein Bbelb_303530 [Branchiostoma belcheri]